MDSLDGLIGWTHWMDSLDGLIGWTHWMDSLDGLIGWTHWMDSLDGLIGWSGINLFCRTSYRINLGLFWLVDFCLVHLVLLYL